MIFSYTYLFIYIILYQTYYTSSRTYYIFPYNFEYQNLSSFHISQYLVFVRFYSINSLHSIASIITYKFYINLLSLTFTLFHISFIRSFNKTSFLTIYKYVNEFSLSFILAKWIPFLFTFSLTSSFIEWKLRYLSPIQIVCFSYIDVFIHILKILLFSLHFNQMKTSHINISRAPTFLNVYSFYLLKHLPIVSLSYLSHSLRRHLSFVRSFNKTSLP